MLVEDRLEMRGLLRDGGEFWGRESWPRRWAMRIRWRINTENECII